MIRIHKEGRPFVNSFGLLLVVVLVFALWTNHFVLYILSILIGFLFLFSVQFFRNPNRNITSEDPNVVYAPADGKVVVIEKVRESEVLNEDMMQLSIFMSPINVHVNRNPVSGIIAYYQYHKGKFLVAWDPKSSMENERTTTVYDTGNHKILVRQIAGAVARRILNYLKTGQSVKQGDDMGFIRFGSRVDVLVPLDSEIMVALNENVKGNRTILARLTP